MPRIPIFSTFGERLLWAYANLQMLHYAIGAGKRRYDLSCYMVRSKAYKAYREGRWQIHDLLAENTMKIRCNDRCWYCGCTADPASLTRDHVFARSCGGSNDMDNIIMVCRRCNSSKGTMDLLQWYAEVRQEQPPLRVLVHYLKNIYQYAVANGLMNLPSETVEAMDLPFNPRYIPLRYPAPEDFMKDEEKE